MSKDSTTGNEIVMTEKQERQHDREYRALLIKRGLLTPKAEKDSK